MYKWAFFSGIDIKSRVYGAFVVMGLEIIFLFMQSLAIAGWMRDIHCNNGELRNGKMKKADLVHTDKV